MDFLKQLGALALSSRLRRLADRLSQDVMLLYQELQLDFEPRWFPVFSLLSQHAPMGVVEIAKLLGISHPAVNQIAGELIDRGLVCALKDASDKRKRLLTLSEQGQALLPALEETWIRMQTVMNELLAETGVDVMDVLETLERVTNEQGLYARYRVVQVDSHLEDRYCLPSGGQAPV